MGVRMNFMVLAQYRTQFQCLAIEHASHERDALVRLDHRFQYRIDSRCRTRSPCGQLFQLSSSFRSVHRKYDQMRSQTCRESIHRRARARLWNVAQPSPAAGSPGVRARVPTGGGDAARTRRRGRLRYIAFALNRTHRVVNDFANLRRLALALMVCQRVSGGNSGPRRTTSTREPLPRSNAQTILFAAGSGFLFRT